MDNHETETHMFQLSHHRHQPRPALRLALYVLFVIALLMPAATMTGTARDLAFQTSPTHEPELPIRSA